MKAGDEIEAMGPMGAFYILEECMKNNIVFISTGTGIAPFRAMINSLLENNYKNKLKLISGYRYKKDVLYEEEFKNLEKKYENFNYYRILSKEGEEKGRGYVQKLISENLELDTYYYICGLKEMVNSVKDFLIEKGIEKEKIVIEKYD
jgi:NAD(P)H-flavin reductase